MKINIEMEKDELAQLTENSSIPDYRLLAIDKYGQQIEVTITIKESVKA